MKRICQFFTLFLLHVNFSNAQSVVKGIIKDANKNSQEFATITLQKDTILMYSTLSNTSGEYVINNITNGVYKLQITLVGYIKIDTVITLDNNLFLSHVLIQNKNTLKAVTIESKKPLFERRADRLIFNVENSLSVIGSDALETIAKTPGVRVTRTDISLIGKSQVSVLINNKFISLRGDDLINYLKSISSDEISKIEIITNPSAKYDAQGNSGLINIVLKKNKKQGYNGSIRLGAIQSYYFTTNGGILFNYSKNKIKIGTSYNITNGSTKYTENNQTYYSTQSWLQDINSRNFQNRNSYKIDIDYSISKNTNVGGYYSGSISKPNSNSYNQASVYNSIYQLDSTTQTLSNTKEYKNLNTINLYLEHKFDTIGKKITINTDWLDFQNNGTNIFSSNNFNKLGLYIPNSFEQNKLNNTQQIQLYTINTDFELPFNKYLFSIGLKFSFLRNKNNLSVYNFLNNQYSLNNSKSNQFDYSENLQAFYFDIARELEKWSFKAGIRLENTIIKGFSLSNNQTNKNEYRKIFPTLAISYNLNDNNTLSLNYGKRIDRPAYLFLNPFREYSTVYAYTEGNPALKPSFTDNIEVTHTYKDLIITTLAYTNEKSKFDIITFLENNSNVQATTYLNFLNEKNLSGQIVLNYDKLKWMTNSVTFAIGYINSKSTLAQTGSEFKNTDINFSTTNQFILDKKKSVITEINFEYQFPSISGIQKSSYYYILGASIKKTLLKKKFTIALNFDDILKTNNPLFNSKVNNIYRQTQNYWDDQRIKITLRYKFGKDKKVKSEERNISNKEEVKRIKE